MDADARVKPPVFRSSSPPLSFIVALFCAAAIFNRLVLHSHPCRPPAPESGERFKTPTWECFIGISHFKKTVLNNIKHICSEYPRLSRLFLLHWTPVFASSPETAQANAN